MGMEVLGLPQLVNGLEGGVSHSSILYSHLLRIISLLLELARQLCATHFSAKAAGCVMWRKSRWRSRIIHLRALVWDVPVTSVPDKL